MIHTSLSRKPSRITLPPINPPTTAHRNQLVYQGNNVPLLPLSRQQHLIESVQNQLASRSPLTTASSSSRNNEPLQVDVHKIWEAIHSGDIAALEDSLRNVPDIDQLLIPGEDHIQIVHTQSCLHWAIYYKNYELIKYLIEQKGARVDHVRTLTGTGTYDLNHFLETDTFSFDYDESHEKCGLLSKILRYLISRGASVDHMIDLRNGVQGPTLSYYIRHTEFRQVQLLIETANANVNLEDSEGHPPLYHALDHLSSNPPREVRGKIEFIINLLDNYDADIEHKDAEGNTLLIQFAKQGNAQAIQQLLSMPVDITAKNLDGKNALDCALDALVTVKNDPEKAKNIYSVARLLTPYETKENLNEKLKFQIKQKNIQAILALCQFGANIEYRDERENTPLILFTKWGASRALKKLLLLNPNKNAVNSSGKTALTLAQEIFASLPGDHPKKTTFIEIIRLLQEQHVSPTDFLEAAL